MREKGWRQRLKGQGYRMTRPREVILDVLGRAQEHLTAKEVYLRAHRIYPSCGMTTIYRTLELLVDMNLVQKFAFGEGQSRFELAEQFSGKPHHHHLVCKKCSLIIEYSDFLEEELELVKKSEQRLAKKHAFEIQEHEITFKGLCSKCR